MDVYTQGSESRGSRAQAQKFCRKVGAEPILETLDMGACMGCFMLNFPIPDYTFDYVTDITPQFLQQLGIELMLVDLDNTMAPYGFSKPSPRLRRWVRDLKQAGIEPYIVSNNRGKRPSQFAEALGIGYLRSANKPFTARLSKLFRQKGADPKKTALAGDQIFADVLCARRAGITSIIVRPMKMRNPFIMLRYGIESPFRIVGKRRQLRASKIEGISMIERMIEERAEASERSKAEIEDVSKAETTERTENTDTSEAEITERTVNTDTSEAETTERTESKDQKQSQGDSGVKTKRNPSVPLNKQSVSMAKTKKKKKKGRK